MGQARQRRRTREERVAKVHSRYGVKPLTRERYDAYVGWTKAPIADFVATETEAFSSMDEALIGVVLLDHSDEDFGFVVLGRDERKRFRAIDVAATFARSHQEARLALFEAMRKHSATGQKMFPQGIPDRGQPPFPNHLKKMSENAATAPKG